MTFVAGMVVGGGIMLALYIAVNLIAYFSHKGGGGPLFALALAGLLGCSRGCAHAPTPPPGPYPVVSCDLACTSFAAACPQAATGCLDLCSAVTDPTFAGCISKATSCDQGSACDRGAGQ